jgi:hypothetical protein
MSKSKPSAAPAAPAQQLAPTVTPADPTSTEKKDTSARAAIAETNDTPQLLTGQGTDEEAKRRREGLLTGMTTQ